MLDIPARPGLPWGVRPAIADALLTSPNDITAVGGDAFYVTNLQGGGSVAMRLLRAVAGTNQGNVLYYDGTAFDLVMDLPLANGIVADREAELLYVANSSDGMLRTLSWRDGHPARPMPDIAHLPLGARADNIDIEPGKDGALLVAAHPSLLRLIGHSFGSATAPSLVLRVPRRRGVPTGAVSAVLRRDGDESLPEELSAASVAALYRPADGSVPRLVLGAIFSNRVLVCDLTAPFRP